MATATVSDQKRADRRALVQRAGDLEILPAVARRVIELVGQEDTSASQLHSIIETDQTLAARILKMANSAFFGLRREVSSLQQAIMVLGFNRLKNLVVAASAKAMYKRFGMTEQMMWSHAVGVAAASRVVCKEAGAALQEAVFLGGLLHDVGKVIMNNETPQLYAEVMKQVYTDGRSALEVERDVYGFTHDEVGAGVVEKWGLPEDLTDIIGRHHSWETDTDPGNDPEQHKAVAIVNLGDHMCRQLGIGHRHPAADMDVVSLKSARLLGLRAERLPQLIEAIEQSFEEQKAVFH